jgi:nucleoside-diphosphate-sugar epimerase
VHVFITGGTGLIGSAVVTELIDNGHTVLALARSDASARAVEAAGAQPWRGDLADHAALRAGAAQADAVVHLAFGRDFSTADAVAQSVAQETAAIETLSNELVGSDRPFAMVSGTPWIEGRPSTEDDPLPTAGPVGGRGRAMNAALALASQGVRTVAVRMPRTVHNRGEGGFAGLLVESARRTGVSGYPGGGTQRWPAVHALDAAVLFRLALENAPAGSSWHAVADEGDAVREIATVIGRRLGLPVESVSEDTYGPFGPIFAADQPSSSARTRAELGWEPTHPSLLADLENIQP